MIIEVKVQESSLGGMIRFWSDKRLSPWWLPEPFGEGWLKWRKFR